MGAVVNGLGSIVGDVFGVKKSNSQQKISDTAQAQANTVFGEEQQYAQMLHSLITNPSSVTSLPGYQFNLQQGEQAVARTMAGSGYAGSGNEAIALTQYGQNYATSAYDNQIKVLSSLAGLGSPVNPTQSLSTASGAGTASFNELGAVLGSAGFGANANNGGSSGNGGIFGAVASLF